MDFFQCLENHFVLFGRRNSFDSSIKQEMFFNSEYWPQKIKLGANSHLQLYDLKLIFNIKTSDESISKRWRKHASQLSYQCGLSSTIWTQQPKQLSIIDPKCDILIRYLR